MPLPDDILEGLPSPSSFDDEPASLRRDILDELSDHLECAVQRELRHSDDPAAARHAALDRFGNPRQIARQLWLDAMKGQLMNQRIMIGTQIVMIIVIAMLCITFFVTLRQNQRMQEAMLQRIEAMAARTTAADPATAASFDWPRYHVQIVNSNGQGVANLPIAFSGEPYNSGEKLELKATTDSEGLATFGPMRAGGYSVRIVNKTPNGSAIYTRNVAVPPGPDQPPLVVQWSDVQPNPVSVPVILAMPKFDDEVQWLAVVEVKSFSGPDVPRGEQWGWPSTMLVIDMKGRVAVLQDFNEYDLANGRQIAESQLAKLDWADHVTLDSARRNSIGSAGFYCLIKPRQGPTKYQYSDQLPFSNKPLDLSGSPPQALALQPYLTEDFAAKINERIKGPMAGVPRP